MVQNATQAQPRNRTQFYLPVGIRPPPLMPGRQEPRRKTTARPYNVCDARSALPAGTRVRSGRRDCRRSAAPPGPPGTPAGSERVPPGPPPRATPPSFSAPETPRARSPVSVARRDSAGPGSTSAPFDAAGTSARRQGASCGLPGEPLYTTRSTWGPGINIQGRGASPDKAHRNQYDFIDGFARHMRDALPKAAFIGFTGTPIELMDKDTRAVFGDYISIYDIQRAGGDGTARSPSITYPPLGRPSANSGTLPCPVGPKAESRANCGSSLCPFSSIRPTSRSDSSAITAGFDGTNTGSMSATSLPRVPLVL